MRAYDLLLKIREPWIQSVTLHLSKGEGVRDALLEELNRFYDMLLQSVETGDSGWLKPVLIEWAQARTETELREEEITISPVLKEVVTQTTTVAREELASDEAVFLVETLMPIFIYGYEIIAQQESLVRISYVSTELEQVRSELERLDRSKSDFIAVAAHELKTPLTLIEGYASMLGDMHADEDENSPSALLIKGIGNGTRRLEEIIDDMIDVSMIDNNLLSLNFQPTWLNRLFDVLAVDAENSIKERKQNLEIREFQGSDEMIFADSERLYQAFRNLLTNAVKYTPDGGTIVIDGRTLAGFVEVTISDSGIGIDAEDHSRIFQKFGRLGDAALHSSSKTRFKGGGPGLGLPITKGILEAHGGTIWVESEGYDEEALPGSVFHVLLPLRTEPPDDKLAKLFQPLSDAEEADVSGKR